MSEEIAAKVAEAMKLVDAATRGEWLPGHLADDTSSCNCQTVFSEGYAGGIGEVFIDNGLSISEGGNDAPPLAEAKANLRLFAASRTLIPDLCSVITELSARNAELDRDVASTADERDTAQADHTATRIALGKAVGLLKTVMVLGDAVSLTPINGRLWEECRDAFLASLPATPSPVPASVGDREIGWLIEQRDTSHGVVWLTLSAKGYWTRDSLLALRFARKVDAEAWLAHDELFDHDKVQIVEHEWVDARWSAGDLRKLRGPTNSRSGPQSAASSAGGEERATRSTHASGLYWPFSAIIDDPKAAVADITRFVREAPEGCAWSVTIFDDDCLKLYWSTIEQDGLRLSGQPDGWQLVPKAATEAMLIAGSPHNGNQLTIRSEGRSRIFGVTPELWIAMLAAAPSSGPAPELSPSAATIEALRDIAQQPVRAGSKRVRHDPVFPSDEADYLAWEAAHPGVKIERPIPAPASRSGTMREALARFSARAEAFKDYGAGYYADHMLIVGDIRCAVEAITAAIATPAVDEGWQTMKTAPKDGRWIIGLRRGGVRVERISWGRAGDDALGWCSADVRMFHIEFVGWIPCPRTVPAPPVSALAKTTGGEG